MKFIKTIKTIIDKSPITRRWGTAWGIASYITAFVIILALIFLIPDSEYSSISTYAIIEKGDFYIDLVETGDIEAKSQHFVSAPMMWGAKLQVIELVEEGAIVQKGDSLIQFDASDLRTQYDLAVDRLNSLVADLNKLDAQQKLTIQNMENQLKLTQYSHEQAELRLEMSEFESDARKKESLLQLKQSEIDLKRVATQLESQRIINHSQRLKTSLSIKQSRYRVDSFTERMKKLVLTAPEDGMVVYSDLNDERLKEGYEARPGNALMSIPDLSQIQVKSYINEVDRQKVAEGQAVKIRLEAYPESEFEGTIRDVSMLARNVDYDSELKGFIVIADINLQEPDIRLKPGMTAVMSILEDELTDVLTVPMGAVFEKAGQPVVCPYKRKGTIPVEVIARNDARAVIRGNVKEGQKLSWEPSADDIFVLGRTEEVRRVELLKDRIVHSFSVFEDRGILFDYLDNAQADAGDEGENKSDIDISKLPPSIRARLEKDKTENNPNPPQVKVGEADEKVKKNEFKVTPEMMQRLEQNKK